MLQINLSITAQQIFDGFKLSLKKKFITNQILNMKPLEILLLAVLLISAMALEGNDPWEEKPADIEAYQTAAYLKILKGPKTVYDSCQPFYKRVFYNIDNVPSSYRRSIERTHQDPQLLKDNLKIINLQQELTSQPEQPLDMYIYFNTNISCPKSYVTVEIFETKIFRFNCEEQMLQLTGNGTKWEQFVHRCRVFVSPEKASFVDAFKYIIYSQVANLEDEKQVLGMSQKEIKALKAKVRTSEKIEVEVVRKQITTKMIVLGDWAPIKVRPYLPIHESLGHLVQLRQKQKQTIPLKHEHRITGLVIAGDIAYNLEDYNCMKYNWFMSELQKVSPYWPIIICPGNHDDVTPGNRYLLTHSFEIGRMSIEDGNYTRVKWMRFPGLVNFVMFDPFEEIYNRANGQQTVQMSQYFQSTINQIQNHHPNEFTIVMSHYPIACSQMTDSHCNAMILTNSTKDLLDFMSTERDGKPRPVDLYIGSHMHQFERVFPYANGTFEIGEKSAYKRGHMVSVVEGAAGCDYGMISQDFPRKDFSVSATYNKTGYAFMTIYGTSQIADKTKYSLNYLHVAASPAPQYFQNIDEFTLYGQVPIKDGLDELVESFNEKLEQVNKILDQWSKGWESLRLAE